MTNRSKQVGTAWESAIVTYLNDSGYPHAERRTLSGSNDKGDIAGLPGICIEAKSCKTVTVPAWIDEVIVEKANANAVIGVVWWKRRGRTSPASGFVAMTGEQFVELLKLIGR